METRYELVGRFAILPTKTEDGWVWLRCYLVERVYDTTYDRISYMLGLGFVPTEYKVWHTIKKYKRFNI